MTVTGTAGFVGSSPTGAVSPNTRVVMQGTIQADIPGSAITLRSGTASVQGRLRAIAPGSVIDLSATYSFLTGGIAFTAAGGQITFSGTYTATGAALALVGGSFTFTGVGTAAAPLLLEAPSQNRGPAAGGFSDNAAVDSLTVGGNGQVRLVDAVHTTAGAGAEAAYVNALNLAAGSTLDLGGLTLFNRAGTVAGSVTGGTFVTIPDSGPISLNTPTPGRIAVAGELDEWAFFGRAGQAVTVLANPGTGGTNPAPDPPLNFVDVRVLDAAGNVLASGSNAVSGAAVNLAGVPLPADGTYRVRVKAGAGGTGNTGNYVLGVHDATVNAAPVLLNRATPGTLANPFTTDRWTFAARAGQQVRFRRLSATVPTIQFKLSGPGNYTGFSGLTGDSPLLTLPADGTYALDATAGAGVAGSYAFSLEETTQTALTLGVPYAGTLAGSASAQVFRVDVPAGKQLLVKLQDGAAADRNELYVKYGAAPTRESYDQRFSAPGSANQQVLVRLAAPGTYYALVYGDVVPAPSSFTLTATATDVFLSDATPDRADNTAPATLTLTGAGFVTGTSVELVAAGGTSFPATAVDVDSFTQVTATFAAGLPTGTYALRVAAGASSDTLPNALTVTAGGAPHLETRLILPGSLGRHATATLYVEYANTGTAAMPAPLLSVQSADADDSDRPILTLDASRLTQDFWSSGLPPGTGNSALILGSGRQPGVLNPGERVRVPVYYLGLEQPWDFGDTRVELEVRSWTADDTSPVDWSGQSEALRPPLLAADAWDAVFGNLTGGLTTAGAYVRMLDRNAQYLGRLGETVTSVDDLWNFAARQAYGFSALTALDAAVDAALPAPGVALDFARQYGNLIGTRYATGPLGRGWFSPRQTRLVTSGAGDLVQVVGEGGSARTFQRDTRPGGGYFSPAGDGATLVALGAGIYELRDPGGNVTRFRADGRIDFVRDPNDNRVTAAYDGSGRLTALTHTSGAALTFLYNFAGLMASVTDSAGRTTTYGYDPTNTYLTTVTTADGKVTRYTYQAAGTAAQRHALLSVERGGTTQFFTYDPRGRLDSTYLTGGAQLIHYGYDDAGLVTVADNLGTTSVYFDRLGLPVKVTDPLGNTTTNDFDADFRLSRTVAPTGESQSFTWDGSGSLTSSTNELGQTTAFQYDSPFQRMTGFTDARGNSTSYAYDASGNLLSTVYPNGTVEQLADYTASGLPQTAANRRGQAMAYQYNAAGQVTRQTFADGSFVSFQYDPRGNLTQITDGTGVTIYSYDYAVDGDRLERVTYPNGRYLDYGYDAFGRRTRMTDQDGYTTYYDYDPATGALWRLRDGSGAVLVAYTYDGGRLARIDKGNGTFTTYQYDAAGQLLSLKNWRNTTTLNSKFDYAYDSRGRRTSMATLDGTWTYTYDGSGQLTRAVFVSANPAITPNQDLQYSYDPAGNRTQTVLNGVTTTYVADGLNQYTSVSDVAQIYDADGNLTFDGTNAYTYDQQNRLVRVIGPDDVSDFEYDALGNRVAAVHDDVRSEYSVDPTGLATIVAEYDNSGNSTAKYAYGLGLVNRRTTTGSYVFDFDAQGNTVSISDSAGGYVNSYGRLDSDRLTSRR